METVEEFYDRLSDDIKFLIDEIIDELVQDTDCSDCRFIVFNKVITEAYRIFYEAAELEMGDWESDIKNRHNSRAG